MTFDMLSLAQAAWILLAGVAVAFAALWLVTRHTQWRAGSCAASDQPDIAFLFRAGELVDASDAAWRLFDFTEPDGSDLDRIACLLAPRFAGLAEHLGTGTQEAKLASQDGRSRLCLTAERGNLRITLRDLAPLKAGPSLDRHSLAVLADELTMLRRLCGNAPYPVWRQDADGQVTWCNTECRALGACLHSGKSTSAPQRSIFADEPAPGDGPGVRRVSLNLPNEAEPRWFELQTDRIADDLLVTALPADRIVRAERSLSDFIQTLTQTFAHLNVGLAVFGRNRELAVFNPALTDLLGLQPEFLISRPTLFQVFDRLRERRMVPETKDYKSWRRRMTALEVAAADGAYSETWSLVDGRTFRVTGRPHPEGAVAFLFEDISAEISLERKFRAKLQLERAVIDSVEEAIAVFTPPGRLALSNRAYAALWQIEAAGQEAEPNFIEASRIWQKHSVPTPVWGDARDFSATISERSNWTADVRLRDGRTLCCRFDALPGGFTLAGFSEPLTLALPAPSKSLSA